MLPINTPGPSHEQPLMETLYDDPKKAADYLFQQQKSPCDIPYNTPHDCQILDTAKNLLPLSYQSRVTFLKNRKKTRELLVERLVLLSRPPDSNYQSDSTTPFYHTCLTLLTQDISLLPSTQFGTITLPTINDIGYCFLSTQYGLNPTSINTPDNEIAYLQQHIGFILLSRSQIARINLIVSKIYYIYVIYPQVYATLTEDKVLFKQLLPLVPPELLSKTKQELRSIIFPTDPSGFDELLLSERERKTKTVRPEVKKKKKKVHLSIDNIPLSLTLSVKEKNFFNQSQLQLTTGSPIHPEIVIYFEFVVQKIIFWQRVPFFLNQLQGAGKPLKLRPSRQSYIVKELNAQNDEKNDGEVDRLEESINIAKTINHHSNSSISLKHLISSSFEMHPSLSNILHHDIHHDNNFMDEHIDPQQQVISTSIQPMEQQYLNGYGINNSTYHRSSTQIQMTSSSPTSSSSSHSSSSSSSSSSPLLEVTLSSSRLPTSYTPFKPSDLSPNHAIYPPQPIISTIPHPDRFNQPLPPLTHITLSDYSCLPSQFPLELSSSSSYYLPDNGIYDGIEHYYYAQRRKVEKERELHFQQIVTQHTFPLQDCHNLTIQWTKTPLKPVINMDNNTKSVHFAQVFVEWEEWQKQRQNQSSNDNHSKQDQTSYQSSPSPLTLIPLGTEVFINHYTFNQPIRGIITHITDLRLSQSNNNNNNNINQDDESNNDYYTGCTVEIMWSDSRNTTPPMVVKLVEGGDDQGIPTPALVNQGMIYHGFSIGLLHQNNFLIDSDHDQDQEVSDVEIIAKTDGEQSQTKQHLHATNNQLKSIVDDQGFDNKYDIMMVALHTLYSNVNVYNYHFLSQEITNVLLYGLTSLNQSTPNVPSTGFPQVTTYTESVSGTSNKETQLLNGAYNALKYNFSVILGQAKSGKTSLGSRIACLFLSKLHCEYQLRATELFPSLLIDNNDKNNDDAKENDNNPNNITNIMEKIITSLKNQPSTQSQTSYPPQQSTIEPLKNLFLTSKYVRSQIDLIIKNPQNATNPTSLPLHPQPILYVTSQSSLTTTSLMFQQCGLDTTVVSPYSSFQLNSKAAMNNVNCLYTKIINFLINQPEHPFSTLHSRLFMNPSIDPSVEPNNDQKRTNIFTICNIVKWYLATSKLKTHNFQVDEVNGVYFVPTELTPFLQPHHLINNNNNSVFILISTIKLYFSHLNYIIYSILSSSHVILTTCYCLGEKTIFQNFTFPYTIIDDAHICSETQLLIPLLFGAHHTVLIGLNDDNTTKRDQSMVTDKSFLSKLLNRSKITTKHNPSVLSESSQITPLNQQLPKMESTLTSLRPFDSLLHQPQVTLLECQNPCCNKSPHQLDFASL